jgi:hypothetical protein
MVPPPQLVTHVPCEQTFPDVQTCAHCPQLSGSFEVFAQLEPHRVWPVGHDAPSAFGFEAASRLAEWLVSAPPSTGLAASPL